MKTRVSRYISKTPGNADDDESDKHLEARDRRYSCLKSAKILYSFAVRYLCFFLPRCSKKCRIDGLWGFTFLAFLPLHFEREVENHIMHTFFGKSTFIYITDSEQSSHQETILIRYICLHVIRHQC